jgi:hypothetical protein
MATSPVLPLSRGLGSFRIGSGGGGIRGLCSCCGEGAAGAGAVVGEGRRLPGPALDGDLQEGTQRSAA